jgi:sugar lactone lactonase YvrE
MNPRMPIGASVLVLLLAASPAATAPSEITVNDTDVFPESITRAQDGTLIFGSLGKPILYRATPGSSTAEPWIHLEGVKTVTLGVLANSTSNTLYACVVDQVSDATPPAQPQRRSSLRAFDLRTGAAKGRYPLPGDSNTCNDISIGPDAKAYITDTPNGRVLRLNGDQLEVVVDDKAHLASIDGLTFLGGVLYVNTVMTGHIYRVPLDNGSKAGALVDMQLSQPLAGPDGMRAQGNVIYVAENQGGRVSALRITGDRAEVTVLKSGYQTPTGVAPAGDTLWVSEAKFNYQRDPKLGNPNPFKAFALALN